MTTPAFGAAIRTAVVDEPIRLAEHEAYVAGAASGTAGAIVGFCGAVRNHDGGRAVTALSYSAHPSATRVLGDLVIEIVGATPGVRAVAVSHRIGDLVVGDAAFVVAVAADHRQAAFEICGRLVDGVKAGIPVWKHQFFADGSDEWVGSA